MTLFTGTSAISVALAFVWKYVLHQSFCGAAYAIFPDSLVDAVATVFQPSYR